MIHKEKYLVYNKENFSLEMNDEESKLFQSLHHQTPNFIEQEIKKYLTKTKNKNEAIERLEEIFDFHNSISGYFNVADELNIIFELKQEIQTNSKPDLNKLLTSPAEIVQILTDYMVHDPVKKRKQKAALTLQRACRQKQIKASGPMIANFFFTNGIVQGVNLSSLTDYFKKGDLLEVDEDPNLFEQIKNLV